MLLGISIGLLVLSILVFFFASLGNKHKNKILDREKKEYQKKLQEIIELEESLNDEIIKKVDALYSVRSKDLDRKEAALDLGIKCLQKDQSAFDKRVKNKAIQILNRSSKEALSLFEKELTFSLDRSITLTADAQKINDIVCEYLKSLDVSKFYHIDLCYQTVNGSSTLGHGQNSSRSRELIFSFSGTPIQVEKQIDTITFYYSKNAPHIKALLTIKNANVINPTYTFNTCPKCATVESDSK